MMKLTTLQQEECCDPSNRIVNDQIRKNGTILEYKKYSNEPLAIQVKDIIFYSDGYRPSGIQIQYKIGNKLVQFKHTDENIRKYRQEIHLTLDDYEIKISDNYKIVVRNHLKKIDLWKDKNQLVAIEVSFQQDKKDVNKGS